MFEKILQKINSETILESQDIELVKQFFEPVLFPKNRIIEEADRTPKYLYFVNSGYLRLFHYDEKGDEVTTHINCPPGFITSYEHFINQTTSEEYLECVTECELLRISKDALESGLSQSSQLKDFSIWVLQQSIVYNENRSLKLANLSAKERYQDLISNDPGLIHHVPIQYLASFLGMKPESLSRIRKQIIS